MNNCCKHKMTHEKAPKKKIRWLDHIWPYWTFGPLVLRFFSVRSFDRAYLPIYLANGTLCSGSSSWALAPANHCTVTDRSLQPQVDRCNLHVSELKIRRLKVQQHPTFQKNQGLPVTTSWSKPRNTLKHLLRWPRDHRSWYLQGDGTRPQCRPIGNSGT